MQPRQRTHACRVFVVIRPQETGGQAFRRVKALEVIDTQPHCNGGTTIVNDLPRTRAITPGPLPASPYPETNEYVVLYFMALIGLARTGARAFT